MTFRFALALALAAALAGASVGHASAASGLGVEPAALPMAAQFPAAAQFSTAEQFPVTAQSPAAAQFPLGGGDAPQDEASGDDRVEPRVEPAPDGDGLTLSADFDVPLTRSLAEAVHRGVPLYFTVEFELYRPRWWWYDELVIERSKTWRLTYHALTRQYRVTADGVIYPFESLDAALRSIVRVRHWRIVSEADALDAEGDFEAQVRLRLDTSQLPKPFQIRGLTNRDWNPQSEWKRFTITLPIPKSAR